MFNIKNKLFPNITKTPSVIDKPITNISDVNNKLLDQIYNYLKDTYKADMSFNKDIGDSHDITQLYIYNILSKMAIISIKLKTNSEKDNDFVRFLNNIINDYDNTVIHKIYKSFFNIDETIEDGFTNLT